MIDIINAFFSWVSQIMGTFLQIEIIDGFKFYHMIIFLALTRIIINFIVKRRNKNEKSE